MNRNWILKKFGRTFSDTPGGLWKFSAVLDIAKKREENFQTFLTKSLFFNKINFFPLIKQNKIKISHLTSQLRNYCEWNAKFFLFFRDFSLIWPQARSFFICDQFEMLILQEQKNFSFHRVLAVLLIPCMYIDIREERFFWGFVCSKSSSTPVFAKKDVCEASHFTSCLIYSINIQSVQNKKN